MNNYSGKFLNKFGLVFILAMALSACGGGGSDSSSTPTPTPAVPSPAPVPGSSNVTGGAVDGPFANAVVTVYAFDASKPGFKGAVMAVASTDASTAITGLGLPLPLKFPYIMEVTSVAATIDITTGVSPVLTTLRTIITKPLLDSGIGIYATPLTTLAVDVAVMNAADSNGVAGIQADEFKAALTLAAAKVVSTLGFGLDSTVDIISTLPLINSATISIAEQAKVAQYRSAIEAITAIVYQISQQFVGVTADAVLADLAADLADNNSIDGSSGSTLNANSLQVLQQNPSLLTIPNTSPVQTVADVQAILAAETAITGSTTVTTSLIDGAIVTKMTPARADADSDGDGVLNADDDLPDNKDESVDSDGDGVGDNADPDDDNDGILDEDEGLTSTPTVNDTDGDGFDDGADNCPNNFNPAQTDTDNDTEGDACDLDDDGDGVIDTDDAFPIDGTRSVDTDGDGIDDSTDIDDDNDGIYDAFDTGFGLDGLTSCSLLVDCDEDGILDGVDADRTNPDIAINFVPVAVDDTVTTDEDTAVTTADVRLNDFDTENDPLTATLWSNASNGDVIDNNDGTFTYTPDADFNGTDSFSYSLTESSGIVPTVSVPGVIATVFVTVNPVNDTPIAVDDAVTTDEDTVVVTGDVTVNDIDVDGDALTATLLEGASNGSVVDNGDGTFTYTPNLNFNGNDSFKYTVSDGNGSIVPAASIPPAPTTGIVSITVTSVNDNPIASNDSTSVDEGQSIIINLAFNDTDIDNALDLTSIFITLGPSHGELVVNADGTVVYTHDSSETVVDSFAYTILDMSGAVSNVASVSLSINPVIDPPVGISINAIANTTVSENTVYTGVTPMITGTPIGTLTYTLGGIDASLFTINSSNGVVGMVARDFENPADAGANNVYDLSITVTDTGGNSDSELWSVTVVDAVEVSAISINAIANTSVNENNVYTSVTPTVTGAAIGTLTYALGGTDAGLFTIDSSNGVVSMVARDFEGPADAGANNVYDLSITVMDADGNSDSEPWSVTVVDVIEVSAISINAIANVSVNENSVYTSITPAITGAPVGVLSYILGGTDAGLFTINSTTGVVNMVARDFENPADAGANNVYDLSITVTDADGNSDSEPWSVTVVNVTETATFTISAIANVSINENLVYNSVTPMITGTPISAVTYTLGGADAAAFMINAATGVVGMVARNFESPADANTDNIYDLSIAANDADGNSASQSWSVSVQDVTEVSAISINAITNVSVDENAAYTSVTPTITGTPIGALAYTLSGTDAGLFTLNSATGVVSMVARDFEIPADAGANNVYDLSITVTDADGNSDSEPWSVTVVDVTETATFTINVIANASVDENTVYTGVTPIITGTPIGTLTYTLGGTDAGLFTLNSTTGVVSMVARDFETPADAGANNVYDLTIIATDTDLNSTSQSWSVSVQDVTEVSAISINAIANVSINENLVYNSVTPMITGTPIGAVTYALGGADAAAFTINAATGAVSMVARDFESPADAGANNIYDLTIIATDTDLNSASQSWNVSVQDVTEVSAISIDAIANVSINENSVYTSITPAITGTPIGTLTYTLSGADAGLFTINSTTGVVSMVARDFESPADAGANNVYDLSVTVTDADGNSDSEPWGVTVVDVIEVSAISIAAIANTSVNENNVYTSVTPTITGVAIGTLTYTLGGIDTGLFTINSSNGVVSMVARDFESPVDANTNNIYDLSITVTDADGNSDSEPWSVTVVDVTETATFAINAIANASVDENTVYTGVTPMITGTPIGTLTYTLGGTDAGLFTINSTTGVVNMIARNFESPIDNDANNIYLLTITATDTNNNTAAQSWSVSVQDVIEVSAISIDAIANTSVNENNLYTSVTPKITGTPIGAVTYALGGADAAAFTINAATGVVSMVARDFETPADVGANNVYDLSITVMDADGNSDSEPWSVSVVNLVETATFTIDAIADVSVNENIAYTSVTPAITGAPIGAVTYTLSGSDAAAFTINAATGVVSMVARDFENPVDAGANNVYALTIIATDTDLNSASQSWSVSVQDVTEVSAISINAIANISINENLVYSSVTPTITGTPIGTLAYTLGGTDAGLFTINSTTGVVSMVARDFENPADAGANNVYDLSITVTDADGNSDSEPWSVTVVDVTEAATFTIDAIANVSINENLVYNSATPIITGTPIGAVTYTLSGADAAAFTINAATGVVSMIARDFESPVDVNTDNIYDLSIAANDADGNSASQSWSVSVQDVTEVSAISINAIANVSINENLVYNSVTPMITGTPIGTLAYTLGGTDAGLFTINSTTGVVSMVARDFENPADAGANNVYDLSITVTDADGNSDSEPWNVTVVDVTETATFTINAIANVSINENLVYNSATPIITGTPIGAVTYTLSGADAAAFTVDAVTGVVSMVARDFESPVDVNTDNIYDLSIAVTDADGNSDSEPWSVTVVDVTETATFTINVIANTSVNENNVYTSVTPTITGTPIGAVTYTLSGDDAAAFTIDTATGVVSMVARDFESPVDANTDNIYDLSIAANDADGNSASQSWNVSVQDVTEVSSISINAIANVSINENLVYTSITPAITGTPIGAVIYTLGGADAAAFTIDAVTGVVSMVARDFESPVDAGANNVYDLSITVMDADGNSDSEPWSVTIVDVTEAATFTINAIANVSINENLIYNSVTPMITGTPIGALTYTLSGTDAGLFTVNSATGVVSMVARDFESPADAGANNVYDLSITVTDADGNSDSEPWNVTVVDVTETATFTIDAIANASVDENTAYTGVTPMITGTPIGILSYTLSGIDATAFTIDAVTGVVSMVARDFESPADADANNVYDLTIIATDTDLNSASQSWNVSVQDVTEVSAISIDAIANVSINENLVYNSVTPMITGTPIGAVTYALGGADAAAFTIDAATGAVSMVARDFENPADAGANNIYDLSMTVTDADGNSDSEPWSVTVVDVTETATFTINAIANVSINENLVYNSVTPIITGSPIGAVTYTLSGADAAAFTINAATGVVSMVARDFESPADANTDNIYDLSIAANDTDGNSASQSWSVSVQDVTEVSALSIGVITDVNISENSVYSSVSPVLSGVPIGVVTYTLSGTDSAAFTINAATGVVGMVARDFESPIDANTDNIYSLGIIATDSDNNSASQSWTVSVQNIVELVAIDDDANVNEGESVNIDLAINDTADNALNLGSIAIISVPSNAILMVNPDGTVDYMHDGSETVADLFTYTILDSSGSVSNVATVRLTINPVNDVPVANDANVTTIVNTNVVISNIFATTDADGDAVVLQSNTTPANGAAIYNGFGTFTYAPANGFIGTDSFAYTISDSFATAVGTVTITVTPPGTPIDIVTLMSVAEGGVAGIENAEANVYAYWTDNYDSVSTIFLPEDKLYNHLSGVFDPVMTNDDLLLSGTQWVSEGDIIGTDDGNGGMDLSVRDINNASVEVASFKLTARYQDLSFLPISDQLNTVWIGAMFNPSKTFNAGAKLITDYRFETLIESHILGSDNSCQKDGTTKYTDLNNNCNAVDVDTTVNITGYAQLLSEVVAATAWVDPNNDFSTPPRAVIIATNDLSNKSLMVQLVSGGTANYYEVDWDNTNAFFFVSNAVTGPDWVQNFDSGVEMIHLQVPASFITQYSDDLSNGLNHFLTVQNGFVRQGLKHVIGDVEFSDGQLNGNALNDILNNFSAPVVPGLVELTGTWVSSVASAIGDPALIHIFANGNYESSGSCDLDGSTGMEYGTVSSSGSTADIVAVAQVFSQGLCGPGQGNKTLAVNGDVLTVTDPVFADVIYNRLLGTTNPIVGSWLLGNIQDPGEAHTILTMLDDTTFTLSQDCTADMASGFEYGAYVWDQGNTNSLTGTLIIDSNGGCGLHDNTAMSVSGFTVTVVRDTLLGDTLTLVDSVGGNFIFSGISPAYVIPMTQIVYTLDNLMMEGTDGQMTGTFIWSYPQGGDFANGSAQFTEINIPGFGTDLEALNINFDMAAGIEITLKDNTNNQGIDIKLNFVTPLSPTLSTPIDTSGTATTSTYNIEATGFLTGSFVSGAILP